MVKTIALEESKCEKKKITEAEKATSFKQVIEMLIEKSRMIPESIWCG